MPDTRVAVFIDYQNVYHCARDLFFPSGRAAPWLGSVDPLRLGELLCRLGHAIDPGRRLTGIRVYRGQPDGRSGVKLSQSFDRQVSGWRKHPFGLPTRHAWA